MKDLISEETLIVLGILSGVLFVGSLIATPLLLVRMPVDYFDENRPRSWIRTNNRTSNHRTCFEESDRNSVGSRGKRDDRPSWPGACVDSVRLIASGFPGKNNLERRIFGRPAILRTINSVRAKFGKPPLAI